MLTLKNVFIDCEFNMSTPPVHGTNSTTPTSYSLTEEGKTTNPASPSPSVRAGASGAVAGLVNLPKPQRVAAHTIQEGSNISAEKTGHRPLSGIPYLDETIQSPEGIICHVLDAKNVDFFDAVSGRKSAETRVEKAKGGEKLETKNSKNETESIYIAQPGDAIFINNETDRYVPATKEGVRWKFDNIRSHGYEVSKKESGTAIYVKSSNQSRILPGIVSKPTCVKDAYGKGNHQFLYEGATLKDGGNGRVTGIDGEAFSKTWEVIPKP